VNRFAVKFKRAFALACWAGVLSLAPAALGGEAGWDGVMRDAGVVVDYQPHNTGGLAADSLFREGEFMPPVWQRAVDDFISSETLFVRKISFWGFYAQNSIPVGSETFSIRLLRDSATGFFPDEQVYESTITNPARQATGRTILIGGAPLEYFFQAELEMPMLVEGGQRYWFEISQDGLVNSLFAWEYSLAQQNGCFLQNPFVQSWVFDAPDLAFQLSTVPEPSAGVIAGGFVMFLIVFHRPGRR